MSRLFLFFSFFFSVFCSANNTQIALVTGASRGIGLSIAELLVDEGYIVYASHRLNSSLSRLDELERKYPGRLRPILLDVTDQKASMKRSQSSPKKKITWTSSSITQGSWSTAQ